MEPWELRASKLLAHFQKEAEHILDDNWNNRTPLEKMRIVEDIYAPSIMAIALGALGGSKKSERKTLAARKNAKKPRKKLQTN